MISQANGALIFLCLSNEPSWEEKGNVQVQACMLVSAERPGAEAGRRAVFFPGPVTALRLFIHKTHPRWKSPYGR